MFLLSRQTCERACMRLCVSVCTATANVFGGLWATEEYIKKQRAPLLFLTDSCWDYLAFLG